MTKEKYCQPYSGGAMRAKFEALRDRIVADHPTMKPTRSGAINFYSHDKPGGGGDTVHGWYNYTGIHICTGALADEAKGRYVLLHEAGHMLTPFQYGEHHSYEFWDKTWELYREYGDFTEEQFEWVKRNEFNYVGRSKLSFARTKGGQIPGPIAELSLSLAQFNVFRDAVGQLDDLEHPIAPIEWTSFSSKSTLWDPYDDNGAWVYLAYARLGSLDWVLRTMPDSRSLRSLKEIVRAAIQEPRQSRWAAVRQTTPSGEIQMPEAAVDNTLEEGGPEDAFIEMVDLVRCPECDQVHDPSNIDDPLYECPECGDTFARSESNNGNHQCPNCNRFSSRVGMACPDCNGNVAEDDPYKPTTTEMFRCTEDDETFDSKDEAVEHVKSEHLDTDED